MRKHNARFAQRWMRTAGDRSNFPQSTAHSFANSKVSNFFNNTLLIGLLKRAGVIEGVHV